MRTGWIANRRYGYSSFVLATYNLGATCTSRDGHIRAVEVKRGLLGAPKRGQEGTSIITLAPPVLLLPISTQVSGSASPAMPRDAQFHPRNTEGMGSAQDVMGASVLTPPRRSSVRKVKKTLRALATTWVDSKISILKYLRGGKLPEPRCCQTRNITT